ncbi:hypothetical protein KY284_031963 [Solanum tuberosum]|nr:hypothetical protein KY284_031963 [Solanum tuberosum]
MNPSAMQWHEIERCTTRGSNKTLVYHGVNIDNIKCIYKLAEYDFVITLSRLTLVPHRNSKHIDDDVSRRKSVLHSAHYIKSVESNITQAVLSLESTYKWALTGTPLQNRIGELFSLYIEIPLKLRSNNEERRDAMVFLKHRILEKLLLKRTKKERVADLALSTKTVQVTTRRDSLDIGEYETYKTLFRRSREQLDSVHDGTLMKNYFLMFPMIVRLRQVVDHHYYGSLTELASGNKEAGDVEQACALRQDAVEDPVVSLCTSIHCPQLKFNLIALSFQFLIVSLSIVTSCSHVFCKACLIDFVVSMGRMACPSCTEPLTFDFTANNDNGDSNSEPTVKGFSSSSILNKIHRNEFETSTKLEALKKEISVMVERDKSAKGIVFSQFTSFLDLIQHSLDLSGVNCVQLVGSMSVTARDAAVNKFTEHSDFRILLMSLKDGGVSLNVKVASHVRLVHI